MCNNKSFDCHAVPAYIPRRKFCKDSTYLLHTICPALPGYLLWLVPRFLHLFPNEKTVVARDSGAMREYHGILGFNSCHQCCSRSRRLDHANASNGSVEPTTPADDVPAYRVFFRWLVIFRVFTLPGLKLINRCSTCIVSFGRFAVSWVESERHEYFGESGLSRTSKVF
jgi:hypothetical protein